LAVPAAVTVTNKLVPPVKPATPPVIPPSGAGLRPVAVCYYCLNIMLYQKKVFFTAQYFIGIAKVCFTFTQTKSV
jgi:hypothetical protein